MGERKYDRYSISPSKFHDLPSDSLLKVQRSVAYIHMLTCTNTFACTMAYIHIQPYMWYKRAALNIYTRKASEWIESSIEQGKYHITIDVTQMAAICRKYTHVRYSERKRVSSHLNNATGRIIYILSFKSICEQLDVLHTSLSIFRPMQSNEQKKLKFICHLNTTCFQNPQITLFFIHIYANWNIARTHTHTHTQTKKKKIKKKNSCQIFHYTCCSRPASFSIRPLLILLQSDINSFCCRSLTGN